VTAKAPPERPTLRVAKAIYWAAYDGLLRDNGKPSRHPAAFDKDAAWARASEQQRAFCIHQAACAMAEFRAILEGPVPDA
jgi:hypothetical protein